MASIRNIKRRIRSVSSTQQITNAMNLVAASKLQKAKARLEAARPFFYETQRVIASIVKNSKGVNHPFLRARDEVKGIAVIVVTGDRGLCGGYNVNVSKEAMRLVRSKGNEQMIVIGTKGRDYFRRRRRNIVRYYSGVSETPYYEDAEEIGQMAADLFLKKEVDEVYLVYTQFKSTITHVPTATKILPLDMSMAEKAGEASGEVMEYEPDEETLLDYVVPKYINTVVYGGMVESAACEFGARMASMDNATKNANDMIGKLTLQFNRARQGAITQEITEIVSGANALE